MVKCFQNHIPFFLILFIFMKHPSLTLSQSPFLQQFCQLNGTTSVYQQNLNTLLSTLAPNTNGYGFYSSSFGQPPNTPHAMVLCKGDVELQTCRACINNATTMIKQMCPDSNEAFGWYDDCMLRYSNKSINGTLQILPPFFKWNMNNATSIEKFNEAVDRLMVRLRNQASGGGGLRKFATGNESGPDFKTIYGMTQCTPDLSADNCSECLRGATNDISTCCGLQLYGKIGARAYKPSCFLQFETDYKFYNDSNIFNNTPPAAAAGPTPLPPSPGEGNNTNTTVIIVVASTAGFLIALTFCICIYVRKRKQNKQGQQIEFMDETSGMDIIDVTSLQYDFETISAATDNFSNANKLGQGGFGAVYKGMLSSGKRIAVKRLAQSSGQGEPEFKNEVMLLCKLSHRNLVRLQGFCIQGAERLLIYEFVLNSSLDQFIFHPIKSALLDWGTRYKIINGVAKGLLYLHEDSRLRIIHRDLKASNVLLDAQMLPKIADFGMARLVVIDETEESTKRIVGTYGYMAPEYAMHGHFSVKSDVFSFGVLVLEITSGKKNCFHNGENTEHLISHAWKNWREETPEDLIDSVLMSSSDSTREMLRCIHIGLLCVQENVVDRPTMASIVLMLSSSTLDIPLPSKPAFFVGEYPSSATDPSSESRNEISASEFEPR